MNQATIEPYERCVDVQSPIHMVTVDLVRIMSDWRFVLPYQTVDYPKERVK